MKFFFPDSQDQVDPLFDFVTEEHPVHRVRQRDDRYAHEVLNEQPFDGLLISKPIVDGRAGAAGHYSTASRNRLYREGVRRFFRLDRCATPVVTMGDCGAFTYANDDEPPYHVDEVIDFYEGCGLDLGVAPDHIVFGFVRPGDPIPDEKRGEWERRRKLTLHLADEFLQRHHQRGCSFAPVAVAHGWSPDTYAESVEHLQDLGYRRIAMGGMVPLKTPDILISLEAVAGVLESGVDIHLLGVTRTDEIPSFARLGVTSFDSTSPFRQAFKDERDNYYTLDDTYVALRVQQVDGTAALKRRIAAGQLDQRHVLAAERRCLDLLRRFDRGETTVDATVDALTAYEQVLGERKDRSAAYRRTLEAAPWRACRCGVCDTAGIDVIIFRGSERNKRRGFHNLAVFRRRLDRQLATNAS